MSPFFYAAKTPEKHNANLSRFRYPFIIFFCISLSIIPVATCTNQLFADEGISNSMTFLSVNKNQIVNGQGAAIKLRGFHYELLYVLPKNVHDVIKRRGGDPEQLNAKLNDYWFSNTDIEKIKAFGANVIRVAVRLWELEKAPYTYSETALTVLDDAIERLGNNGIYVIIDLHAAGQNKLNHNKEYGYQLWNDRNLQKRVFALWSTIASRYKDNPFVAAYDLINEPQAPDKQTLHTFYQECIDEIRSKGDNHIIIIEQNLYKPKQILYGGEYSDPNIVLSFHFYKPNAFTTQGKRGKPAGQKYPGQYGNIYWDKNQIETYFKVYKPTNRPLFVGEFSALMTGGQDALQWIRDVIDIMNHHSIHYTYYCYKFPMNNTLAVYAPDKTIYRKINSLMKQIIKGKIKINDLKESHKLLFSTYNFKSSQDLEKILQFMKKQER